MDTVFFDCEPQKNFSEIPVKSHVWDMLMSIATTYSKSEDRYRIWSFNQKNDLVSYLNGKCVVGYNVLGFDLPLVLGEKYSCDEAYNVTCGDFRCKVVDVFYKVIQEVYRCYNYTELTDKMRKHPLTSKNVYSLLTVYSNTVGVDVDKNMFDVKSIEMFRSKKILQLVEYNMYKLRMCKRLYEFIGKQHYVVNGDFDIVKITR